MKTQIKRETLSGTAFTPITFPNICGKYLVKNFSSADIYVSFDENATVNNSAKIPAGFFQIVEGNEFRGGLDIFKTNTIYVKGAGEIEVQQLCFH